ncbi:MAG: ATP-binding cassette domain-containing protein [bacterium]
MIAFQNVSACYDQPNGETHQVLHSIDLTIEQGEFVAIMGRNGSGKTTLARLCNGLILPSEGKVCVNGLEIIPENNNHVQEIRRSVGMVFQNPDNQIVSTTVEREIAFGLENLGILQDEMHKRVDHALTAFDLEKYRHKPPGLLSGGEKQRLALAAVMAMQPLHLVLDEPLAMLDYAQKTKLLPLITDLNKKKSNQVAPTIIFITQDPVEALFAQRLIILHSGKIFLDGPPHEIFLREEILQEAGLIPPIDFSAYLLLKKHKNPVTSLQEILLEPIL